MQQELAAMIEDKLAAKERFLRRRWKEHTPQERLEKFRHLQRASFEILRSSSKGYAHYRARNLKARRVKVIDGKWVPVSTDRRPPTP